MNVLGGKETPLKINPKENSLIVLGNEGDGVSASIELISNYNITVEGVTKGYLFPYNLVDSLNVGVSAGIIIDKFSSSKNC